MALRVDPAKGGSRAFAGSTVDVQALYVKSNTVRCQFRPYGPTNARLFTDKQAPVESCPEVASGTSSSLGDGNSSSDSSILNSDAQGNVYPYSVDTILNGTNVTGYFERAYMEGPPCKRRIRSHLSTRERPMYVTEARELGRGADLGVGQAGARLPSSAIVRCKVPPGLTQGAWQVGLVNFDTLHATPASFLTFEVLRAAAVSSVSPASLSVGSNVPLTLYGNLLGDLLFGTEGARCVFRAGEGRASRLAAAWILDNHRVACYPPPMDVDAPDGIDVSVTLRVHRYLLQSLAVFRLHPHRRIYSAPTPYLQTGSHRITTHIGLAGQTPDEDLPVVLSAQNMWQRGPSALKVWLTPSKVNSTRDGEYWRVEVPLEAFTPVLRAPQVDASAAYPAPVLLSVYFVNPADDAAVRAGLRVPASPAVEVSSMVLRPVPRLTSLNPSIVPSADRSNHATDPAENPVLSLTGVGFMNSMYLRCRFVDVHGGITLSPETRFISTTEVACALPILELPGSAGLLVQVSNDGARWSEQVFKAFLAPALEVKNITLLPPFGTVNGSAAVEVVTASSLPPLETIGCLFGFGPKSRSEAVFLSKNRILCISDTSVDSMGLRRAGGAPPLPDAALLPPEGSRYIGFRLSVDNPRLKTSADPRLTTSKPAGYHYVRTPSFHRIEPAFGSLGSPVIVEGYDYPYGLAKEDDVRCYWALTRAVTHGVLLSPGVLRCSSPDRLPWVRLIEKIGAREVLDRVSFDGGRNFLQVATRGLNYVLLHHGAGPMVARVTPAYTREGRGEYLTLKGGDFTPIRMLSTVFGLCVFSWSTKYKFNLTNDTGWRSSPATFVSTSEAKCKVPRDLPPAVHRLRLLIPSGETVVEARPEVPGGVIHITVVPNFVVHNVVPALAPVARSTQILIHGLRFLPDAADDRYRCVFGEAPSVAAVRLSLTELACPSALHRVGDAYFRVILEAPGETTDQINMLPFKFAALPRVQRAGPTVVLAERSGQTLRISGRHFRSFTEVQKGYEVGPLCRFGEDGAPTTPATFSAATDTELEGVECEVSPLPPGAVPVYLVARGHVILAMPQLLFLRRPVTTGIAPHIFVEGTLLRAKVSGYHLQPLQHERLICRFRARASQEPFAWLSAHLVGWIETFERVSLEHDAACEQAASTGMASPSPEKPQEVKLYSVRPENSSDYNLSGVDDVALSSPLEKVGVDAVEDGADFSWAFGVSLAAACPPNTPLALGDDALRCPEAIRLLVQRLMLQLARGAASGQLGMNVSGDSLCRSSSVAAKGVQARVQYRTKQFDNIRLRGGAGSLVDVPALPDGEHGLTCRVPFVREFLDNLHRQSPLYHSDVVAEEVGRMIAAALSVSWEICTSSFLCDDVAVLIVFAIAEASLKHWVTNVGYGLRELMPEGPVHMLREVYVEIGVSGTLSTLPSFTHTYGRIAIFPTPSVAALHQLGTSVASRAMVRFSARHLDPSLQPRCLVLGSNGTFADFPAVQTSDTTLRCLLTPQSFGKHSETIMLIFATGVNVSRLRSSPGKSGERATHKLLAHSHVCEDNTGMPVPFSTGVAEDLGNSSCKFVVQDKTLGTPEPVGEEEYPLLDVLFVEVATPGRVEPIYVHTRGRGEVSIYGDFSDASAIENAYCAFEGVRQRTRALRISSLEIRCATPARTLGRTRLYVSGLNLHGQPSVRTASVGFMQVEYVEPLELFQVKPSVIMDGSATRLEVWGSNFRNNDALQCRFESSAPKEIAVTHDVPEWSWDGRVACDLDAVARASRSFIMYASGSLESPEPEKLAPAERRPAEAGDPFVCVSLHPQGWYYHSPRQRPFNPRMHDVLVAEVMPDGSTYSLEGQRDFFAGIQFGFDHGDLAFFTNTSINETLWEMSRTLDDWYPIQTTSDIHADQANGSNCSNCTSYGYSVKYDSLMNHSANGTINGLNVAYGSAFGDVDASDRNGSLNDSFNDTSASQATSLQNDSSSNDTSQEIEVRVRQTTTSTSISSHGMFEVDVNQSVYVLSGNHADSNDSNSMIVTNTTMTTTASSTTTSSTSTATTTTVVLEHARVRAQPCGTEDPSLFDVGRLGAVWVRGGKFDTLQTVGLEETFVATEPEFHSKHRIVCPSPESSTWRRAGVEPVRLRVTINGREWSTSFLNITFVTPPSTVDVVAVGDLPHWQVTSSARTLASAEWGPSPSQQALLVRGHNYDAWPNVMCELRAQNAPGPSAFVPSIVLTNQDRVCAVPTELSSVPVEHLRLQLIDPNGLSALFHDELSLGVSPVWNEGSGGISTDRAAQILSTSPDWGWTTGGTIVRIKGYNLPSALLNARGELSVRCDFAAAGIVDAISTSPEQVECPSPPVSKPMDVTVSVLIGAPPITRLSHADARFTYLPRFRLAHITPVLGSAAGGTNVTLTMTTQQMQLTHFEFDCSFGYSRVRASLVQVTAQAMGDRTYTLRCQAPPAYDVPRLTAAGCSCKKLWYSPEGDSCDTHCCNHDEDPRGPYCYVEDATCEGADWGYCDTVHDSIAAGMYPACVRVLPSSAQNVSEHEPCMHRFTYLTSPVVDTVSPRSGPITGGTNVSLHGRYFPQTSMGLLCRFATHIAPARWLSSSLITCVSPVAPGINSGLLSVPVSISINGGIDWVTTYATFTYVPSLQSYLSPDFGPQSGGSVIEVSVPRRFAEGENLVMNQVESCCFGQASTVLVKAARKSDELYTCVAPPWPSPVPVSVGVLQADGRCQELPRAEFTYVKPWRVTSVYPESVSESELGSTELLISGEDFRPYHGATCRFSDGSVTEAKVQQSNTSLICRTPGAPSITLAHHARVRTMEVFVSLNGVDYFGGRDAPVRLRIVPGPSITVAEPTHVYNMGGEPVTLKGSQIRPDLRLCIFGDGQSHIAVPISSLSSEQTVVCTTPTWAIEPPGASMQRVNVRLAVTSIADALTSTAYVTFVAIPEAKLLVPNEGPVEGGTRVIVHGTNFRPVPPEGLEAQPAEVPLRCKFGARENPAMVISDTELACTVPATEAAYLSTGYLAPFSIQTVPPYVDLGRDQKVVSPGPTQQMTYFYRKFVSSFSLVEPLSGPEFGATLVSLRSDYPLLNSRLLRCVFGHIPVDMVLVTAYEATCLSPALYKKEIVNLTLTTDGQNRLPMGPAGSMLQFEYYLSPTVVSVNPTFGTRTGGTLVQIEGSHFINSGRLSCRFGDVDVPAVRFISAEVILCRSPAHVPATVPVVVSNNGQNFSSSSDASYTFINYMFAHLHPYLGPISGNTKVLVEMDFVPAMAKDTIRCYFGGLVAIGEYVNSSFVQCVSPAVVTPGEVLFLVSLNLQDRTEASQKYLYYIAPYISTVNPPLGPSSQALSIQLTGNHFISTHFFRVRFGGVSEQEGGLNIVRPAVAVSSTVAIVELPQLSPDLAFTHRLPLYISNNGQNFAPEDVDVWDPDDDSHDGPKSMRYFLFHDLVKIEQVDPEYGMLYGGGFVNVYGHGFLNTSGLGCSFEWVDSPSIIYVSATHVMCEVPNMVAAPSSHSVGFAQLRVTLNGQDWSRTSVPFRFIGICPIGHYCHHWSLQKWTFRVVPCPAGHYCPSAGLSQPSPCGPGTFQRMTRQVQCQVCPIGFYCPHDRMLKPVECSRGWICDKPGLIVPENRCPRGHYCGPGVAVKVPRMTLMLEGKKPKTCAPGLHCYEGAVTPNPKPHNLTTPQACFQGYYCPPGSSTPFGAGACPLGRYCPTPRHTGILCPERYMCGPAPAQVEPTACPAGTFNPWPGQWNCTKCLQGGVCPRPRLRMPIPCPCGYECTERAMTRAYRLCPAGLMCDEGVATNIEPMMCEEARFDPVNDFRKRDVQQQICDYGIGQSFVPYAFGVQVGVIRERFGWTTSGGNVSGLGLCCWGPDRISDWLRGIALEYRGRKDYLSERNFMRAVAMIDEFTKSRRGEGMTMFETGFDGLMLLNQKDDDWRQTWGIMYPKARGDLWHYIERTWAWTRPQFCPAGSFCEEGTCPRYLQTGVVDVDFFEQSGSVDYARRLTHDYVISLQNASIAENALPGGFRNETIINCSNSDCGDAPHNFSFATDVMEQTFALGAPAAPAVGLERRPLSDFYANSLGGDVVARLARRLGAQQAFGSDLDLELQAEESGGSPRRCDPTDDGGVRVTISLHKSTNGSANGNGSNASLDLLMKLNDTWKAAGIASRSKSGAIIIDEPSEDTLLHYDDYEHMPVHTGTPWKDSFIQTGVMDNNVTNGSVEFVWTLPMNQTIGSASKRRLAAISPPLFNALAMKAPRQCQAGTFCEPRAASAAGTGICPLGMFCNPGVGEPEPAPEGVFVTEPGRVRGMQCFPGQFAPFPATPVCLPCPPGNSCPTFGTTIPYVCPPGKFRQPDVFNVSSSISCEPCGPGTWAPMRGTPDFSACEPCPKGQICPIGTGNVSSGMPCPEGHICGEGTTHHEVALDCYNGFFCGPSTTTESVWINLCPDGVFCGTGTTLVNKYRNRCPQGFYCPLGTGFSLDLQRPLFPDVTYLRRETFYLMQTLALYCTRQRMRFLQRYISRERANLASLGLPDMTNAEQVKILEGWLEEFEEDRYCQRNAIAAVMPFDEVRSRQSVEFLAGVLLHSIAGRQGSDYENKCSRYDSELDGKPWPKCTEKSCEDRPSQLKCLCTAANMGEMRKCFGKPYPEESLASRDCTVVDDYAHCIDESLVPDFNAPLDDFDLMKPNFIQYVSESLKDELKLRFKANENSLTRCPLGTMTVLDGQKQLGSCKKRAAVSYLYESVDVPLARLNPVYLNMSSVKPIKPEFIHEGEDADEEENFRPVYKAEAGDIFLITFDLRHIGKELKYGVDWRINVLLSEELDPTYDDPIECGSMLVRQTEANMPPDEMILAARAYGCYQLDLPPAFVSTYTDKDTMAPNLFTFSLMSFIDSEWRIDIEIVNGLFLQDRFMFSRSAVIEHVSPSRAKKGTKAAFAVVMTSTMLLELPSNMPMKSLPTNERGNSAYYSAEQVVLTKAYMNYLPVNMPILNKMKHKLRSGEGEYMYPEKRLYFQSAPDQVMAHMPYFSNCRGFGRTSPLWALTEQLPGCVWNDDPIAISPTSFGQKASGDTCSNAELECLLDEIPTVKTTNPRWFEANRGMIIFYVTKQAIPGNEVAKVSGQDLDLLPAYLENEVAAGQLPKRVIVTMQYWQRSVDEKILSKVGVYFTELEAVSESILTGNTPWIYKLEVMYYPMSHYEVMVNFAFPAWFYVALFTGLGIFMTGIVVVLWIYHRLLSRFKRPPKLWDKRLWNVCLPQLIRGTAFALIAVCPALFICTALIQGKIFGFLLPFDECLPGKLESTCYLGALDRVPSSYAGETAVSVTTPGQRRTGRTGTTLAIMGSYCAIVALKLMIPERESRYYEDEKTRAEKERENVRLDDGRGSGSEQSEDQSQMTKANEDGDGIAPIFVTMLWKRSCLALCMLANAVLQQVVIQFSFSTTYKENVMLILFTLHCVRVVLKLILTSFMRESMLIAPIHGVSSVTFLLTLNANPTLLDFLITYLVVLGVQMLDRVYLSPCEDVVVGGLGNAAKEVFAFVRRVYERKHGNPLEEDEDSDGEPRDIADANALETEGLDPTDYNTEQMMNFCMGLACDSIGDLLVPIFFCMCTWQYNESRILYEYSVPEDKGIYYVIFYFIMLIFSWVINALSINIVEIYHGWHVLDYYEYCAHRFDTRQCHWKGKEYNYDESVSPHLRSLDQMCFSDQFYFMVVLNVLGILGWLFGLQVIFVHNWNIFDDPTTPVILIGALAVCKGTHMMVLTSADYLKVWVVKRKDVMYTEAGGMTLGVQLTSDAARALAGLPMKPPLPPPPPLGSVHEGWPEPTPRDGKGVERYRQAFLRENQLWLQDTFTEMNDRRMMVQQRLGLLRSLADLLSEVPPDRYAPAGLDDVSAEAFAMGKEPPMHLARASREVQRGGYTDSLATQIVSMWLDRARFLLHLQRVCQMVKLSTSGRADRCEMCGNTQSLVITPIHTLTNLASRYRIQRDMSPLWNMVLWRHFYQTFTPTCTVCSYCNTRYYNQNKDIPVEAKRFRKFTTRTKTPFDLLKESKHGLAILDKDTMRILRYWQNWTRDIARGDQPRDFLPRYGFQGKTFVEIRRELQRKQQEEEAAAEELDIAPELDSEDEDEKQRQAKEKAAKRIEDIYLGTEEELRDGPFVGREVPMDWSRTAIARAWLQMARDNLRAPQLGGWAHHVPAAPPPRPPTAPTNETQGGGRPSQMQGGPQLPPVPRGSVAPSIASRAAPPPPALPPRGSTPPLQRRSSDASGGNG
eukprot:TRINITY_DN1960_c1_g5_i2.p1 TRINITY_DN1960_c1_g5~~TRINITY_DN1960_c1_g5_i2.p1  ORF type:complete len:6923 (-),score=840.57 TRINITY_DN1960_c1_g5_i2:138-18908(-)